VTVMGAGIFGLSIAWVCACRGATVQVVDPRGPGGGASGGVVGALAPHTPENWNVKKAFQFESLVMAETFWNEVDAASCLRSGYGRTGRLQPIIDDHGLSLAKQRERTAAELWQEQAVWQVCSNREFGDWVPQSATGLLIYDTLTARIDPKRACESLTHALAVNGVEILSKAPPSGLVIWATGYEGLLDLSKELARPIGTGVKGQAALLQYDAGPAPQLFADGIHIIPHDNATVAVGSTSEGQFASPTETDEQLDLILKRAVAICPALVDAPVIARWAGVRPRAKSRAPVLGTYPGRPGEFIANGGFKIGFGMAPKVAEVMADLVLDGRDSIPDAFRVEENL